MATAGQTVQAVENVLRARANARRIKEHYDGTLGVPSELQSLSHMLAHDKDAVFDGLEHLPFYNKSSVSPPPQHPVAASAGVSRSGPSHTHRRRAVSLDAAAAADANPSGPGTSGRIPEPRQPPQALPPPQAQLPLPSIWPVIPAEQPAAAQEDARQLPPRALDLDPQVWTAGSVGVPSTFDAAPESSPPAPAGDQDPEQQHHHHHHHHRHHHKHHHHHHRHHHHHPQVDTGAQGDPQRPLQYQQQQEQQGQLMPGAVDGDLASERDDVLSPLSSPAITSPNRGGGEGFGSWGPVSARSVSLSGSVAESETDETLKHRLMRQRLLSAHDLSPQEWARLGPPQDAVDLERFTAREYSVTVGYDRHTLAPKRVARPNIFHISADEAQRRQVEADEATVALQAQRRAEAEAAERAAEEERLARTAYRGPHYDALGVLVVQERTTSPAKPRYLDWRPEGLSGSSGPPPAGSVSATGAGAAQHAQQKSAGYGRGLRSSSAMRTRSQSARAQGHSSRTPQGALTQMGSRSAEADGYVYEDLDDDPDLSLGSAAYGTHPPQRRHHSALAATGGSFSPPQRPAGVTDAHYAQMIRQQRRWLNGPVQPSRPISAAPFPAPLTYVRPRSSRPPPEGTAAPMPSRVAAEAAAVAAAAAALTRQSSALQTVIHQRNLPPPAPRTRSSWAPRPLSANTGDSASRTSSFRQQDGSETAGAPVGGAGRTRSAGGAGGGGKRLPWEAREHAVATLAASIIPTRLTLEGEEPSNGNMGSPRGDNRQGSVATYGSRAAGRVSHASAKRHQSAGRQGGGRAGGGRSSSAVYGETLVPEAVGADGEPYQPRKFEIYDGMVLDGYMARLP